MDTGTGVTVGVKRAKRTAKQSRKKKRHVVDKTTRSTAKGKLQQNVKSKQMRKKKAMQKQLLQEAKSPVKAGRRNFVMSVVQNGKKQCNYAIVLTRVPAVMLIGKARLRCVYGTVKVCGYEITDEAGLSGESHELYSPNSHSHLAIRLSKSSKHGNLQLRSDLPKLLSRLGFSASLSGDVRVFLNDDRLQNRPMAVFVLERLTDAASDLLLSFDKNATLYSHLNTLGFDLIPISDAEDGDKADAVQQEQEQEQEQTQPNDDDTEVEAKQDTDGEPCEEPDNMQKRECEESVPNKMPDQRSSLKMRTVRFGDRLRRAADQLVQYCESLNDQDESVNAQQSTSQQPDKESASKGAPFRLAIAMVFGGKDAGKSTFCRFAINRLLLAGFPRVAHVELDASQSEFAPGGCVSCHLVYQPLFGPSYTHLCDATQPSQTDSGVESASRVSVHVRHFASVLFGSLSPLSNPDAYFDCVRCLFTQLHSDAFHCQLEADASYVGRSSPLNRVVPVVVNTCGWLSGLGASLHLQLADAVQPHMVIELETAPKTNAEDARASRSFFGKLNGMLRHRHNRALIERVFARAHLDGDVLTSKPFTSADRRDMNVLAYFAQLFRTNVQTVADTDAQVPFADLDLGSVVPYRVGWNRVYVACMPHAPIIPNVLERSCVAELFNASIVALCVAKVAHLGDAQAQDSSRGPRWLPATLTNCLETLGFGIIRAVDPIARCFFVLTPLPLSELQRCNVLAKTELELPPYVLTRTSITLRHADVPYVHEMPKVLLTSSG